MTADALGGQVGSVDVTCPGCSHVSHVDPAARSAADFCERCDYPLFWARERVVAPAGAGPDDEGLRRLPGTAGRVLLASVPCPVCTEPNAVNALVCVRCGSDMRPAPVVLPPVVVPAPVHVVHEVLEPRSPWPWVLALVTALLLVVVVVEVLVLGG